MWSVSLCSPSLGFPFSIFSTTGQVTGSSFPVQDRHPGKPGVHDGILDRRQRKPGGREGGRDRRPEGPGVRGEDQAKVLGGAGGWGPW